MAQSLINSLLALLFPERCAGCARTGTLFCAACRAALTVYPADAAGVLPELDGVTVGFVFAGPLRSAIHQFKYKRRRRVAEPLGALLAARWDGVAVAGVSLLPVPLHPSRQAERGFNQSEALADVLAQELTLPLTRAGLVRCRATEQQALLDKPGRQANVRGAFAWQGRSAPPARVLLVDDVLTTGATLGACAQALRAAGTREVHALVLARSHNARAAARRNTLCA